MEADEQAALDRMNRPSVSPYVTRTPDWFYASGTTTTTGTTVPFFGTGQIEIKAY